MSDTYKANIRTYTSHDADLIADTLIDLTTHLDEWAEAITHALGPRMVALPKSGGSFNPASVTRTYWNTWTDDTGELAPCLTLLFIGTSHTIYHADDIAVACAGLDIEVRTQVPDSRSENGVEAGASA